MKRSLTICFLLLGIFCGCSSENQDDIVSDGKTLRFLGDSIIDYWDDVSDYFPGITCFNYGITRMGIRTFLKNVDKNKLVDGNLVIEIGTNDVKWIITNNCMDEYVEEYVDTLQSLRAKKIYLLSILPRNRAKDRQDLNDYIEQLNPMIQKAVKEQMSDVVVYIDLYDIFLKDDQINWDYTYDGLHPNATGYKVMADEIKRVLAAGQFLE